MPRQRPPGRREHHPARYVDSFAYSDGQLVSLVGLENVLVVATKDAVLVADRAHAEQVKAIAEHLNSTGRSEGTFHTRVYRPWGRFECSSLGDRFQVRCIMVKPGAQLSLQRPTIIAPSIGWW